MEEKEVLSSRAEMIRQAREECNKKIDQTQVNGKERTVRRTKTQNKPGISFKLFIIRTVCAVILFLAILIVDQMSLSYKGLKSDTIKTQIASNQTVQDLVNLVSDFTNEKIIPVFHRLKE